jgi:hypothetical protein
MNIPEIYINLKKLHRLENISIFFTCVILHLMNVLVFLKINNSSLHYFFSGYFDDLLAPILLLSYVNLILSIYNKKIYTLRYLILFILLVSIVWEYLVVYIKPDSVSDPLDILCYILGTIIYWIIHTKWNQNTKI